MWFATDGLAFGLALISLSVSPPVVLSQLIYTYWTRVELALVTFICVFVSVSDKVSLFLSLPHGVWGQILANFICVFGGVIISPFRFPLGSGYVLFESFQRYIDVRQNFEISPTPKLFFENFYTKPE